MSGILELTKDLAAEYHLTKADACELIHFINNDIINRLAKGEVVHVDRFGSFHAEDGRIWFNPSESMFKIIHSYQGPKARKEKQRGDRWKKIHEEYLKKLKDSDTG